MIDKPERNDECELSIINSSLILFSVQLCTAAKWLKGSVRSNKKVHRKIDYIFPFFVEKLHSAITRL